MIRSWGIVILTGAAQPLFGDTLTAQFNPSGSGQPSTVKVASTTRYRSGDRIILGAGQAGANIVLVQSVVDATTLSVISEGGAVLSSWANGTIICLSIACAGEEMQSQVGDSGNIYVGSDNTVTNTGGGSAFRQITVGGEYRTGLAQWNIIRTSDFWMAGQLNDKVGVCAIEV